jgi:hypothetical protein
MEPFIIRPDCPKCMELVQVGTDTYTYTIQPTSTKNYVRCWTWNISLARDIIAATPRPAEPLDVEKTAAHLAGSDYLPGHLDHVNIGVPGIMAPITIDGQEGWVLIDGTHRMLRCQRDGQAGFPVYPIERWESLLCLAEVPHLPHRGVQTDLLRLALQKHGPGVLYKAWRDVRGWFLNEIARAIPEAQGEAIL